MKKQRSSVFDFFRPSQKIGETKKMEQHENEQVIMLKLKYNKHWQHIATRVKFRNFIEKAIKIERKHPNFLNTKFEIFKHVDMLH